MSEILGWLVCSLALIILLIAALGVYRLPDAYCPVSMPRPRPPL